MLRAGDMPSVADGTAQPSAGEARLAELDRALRALLLELTNRHARGALTLHDPVLGLARQNVEQAVAMGAGTQYRAALDMLTSALGCAAPAPDLADARTPHLNGVVLPAPPVILKGYESFHWQTSKEAREWARRRAVRGTAADRRSGQENRRFKRYVAPTLWASVEGMHYKTLDWSIGGLALIGRRLDLTPGKEVRVTLAANIREAQPATFEDRAFVLRTDWEAGRLYLQFRSTASATLKILEYIRRRKIEPVEAETRREAEHG